MSTSALTRALPWLTGGSVPSILWFILGLSVAESALTEPGVRDAVVRLSLLVFLPGLVGALLLATAFRYPWSFRVPSSMLLMPAAAASWAVLVAFDGALRPSSTGWTALDLGPVPMPLAIVGIGVLASLAAVPDPRHPGALPGIISGSFLVAGPALQLVVRWSPPFGPAFADPVPYFTLAVPHLAAALAAYPLLLRLRSARARRLHALMWATVGAGVATYAFLVQPALLPVVIVIAAVIRESLGRAKPIAAHGRWIRAPTPHH